MYNMNLDAPALTILLGNKPALQIDNSWLARGFDSYTIVFLVDKSAYGVGPQCQQRNGHPLQFQEMEMKMPQFELIFIDNRQSNMLYATILERVSLLHTQYWNTWYFTLLSLRSLQSLFFQTRLPALMVNLPASTSDTSVCRI